MQIFINASTSDVVATTSLEALALGKWLLCAKHPCNAFPARFRNCLTHTCPQEFSANLKHAQSHPPHPLSDTELRWGQQQSFRMPLGPLDFPAAVFLHALLPGVSIVLMSTGLRSFTIAVCSA